MLKLMQNEIEKISKWKIFFVWLITLGIIVFITSIILMGLGTSGQMTAIVTQNVQSFNNHNNVWAGWPIAASLFGALFTKAAFLFFEAYLISILIIDEFKRKTINQLFSYPIRKSKILWSKILVVVSISLIAQYAAALIIQLAIKLLALTTGSSYSVTVEFFVNLLFITIGTVLVGLLPLVFGMIRYSTVLTMVSSVIIAGIISNAFPGTLSKSLMNSLPFLIVTSMISLVLVSICVSVTVRRDAAIY